MAIQQEEKEVHFEAFINGAKNFCRSADVLLRNLEAANDRDPIYTLYFHATELSLKGFLTFSGEKTATLKKKWGHDLQQLYEDAIARGLRPQSRDGLDFSSVVSLLHSGNKNGAFRYFTWESTVVPDVHWTGKIVNMLIGLVEKQTGYTRGKPGPAVKGTMALGPYPPVTLPR